MSPGEWAGLITVVVIVACLMIFLDDGAYEMYDAQDVDPEVEAHRAEAFHGSGCAQRADREPCDIAEEESEDDVYAKAADEILSPKPSKELQRLMYLTRVAATGHATDDEKRELHDLRIRYGRFEEVVQI